MRGALNIFRKALGEEHPNVATLLNNLGVFLFEQVMTQDSFFVRHVNWSLGEI